MANEKERKKGIFAKLFGGMNSSCCNIKIEEIPDEQAKPKEAPEPSMDSPCCGPCCGDAPKRPTKE